MKTTKILVLSFVAWFGAMALSAENTTLDQINDYAKQQYRNRWKEAALSIKPVLPLNQEGGYTFTTSVRFPGLSAELVYQHLAKWAAVHLDTISTQDADNGLIEGRSYFYSVANQVGGFYRYHLCLHPTIQLQARNGEAQLIVSLQYYEVVKTDKGVVNTLFQTASGAPLPAEQWLVADRYPYNERGKMPFVTAEAYTKSYAYLQVLLSQLMETK